MIILPYLSIIYLLTIYLSIYHLRLCFYSGSLIDVLRVISDQTEANSKEIGLQDLTISLTYAKISMWTSEDPSKPAQFQAHDNYLTDILKIMCDSVLGKENVV
jgi:hypothetical protein